jgi:serine/threonine protein kinase
MGSSSFRAEVQATKRLSHPNIIKVIDHSALDDTSGTPEKQYLVMPIATGGDLGRRERYSLYTGTVDTVILVAKQLANARCARASVATIPAWRASRRG